MTTYTKAADTIVTKADLLVVSLRRQGRHTNKQHEALRTSLLAMAKTIQMAGQMLTTLAMQYDYYVAGAFRACPYCRTGKLDDDRRCDSCNTVTGDVPKEV